jgi:hypothetical protein
MTKLDCHVSGPCFVRRKTISELLSPVLRWLWVSFYSPQAPLMFPYVLPILYVLGYLYGSAFV